VVSESLESVVLILGGARSGKSRFAQELARRAGGDVLYVATAELREEEMRSRAEAHRAERPAGWETVEEPLALGTAVRSGSAATVIVDCLTLWASNVLERFVGEAEPPPAPSLVEARRFALEELERALEAARERRLLFVSNEVGQGIVPLGGLARAYRDLLGEVNQFVARRAGQVCLMVAGLPVDIRRLAEPGG